MLGEASAPSDLEPIARLEQRPRPPAGATMDEAGMAAVLQRQRAQDRIVLGVRADAEDDGFVVPLHPRFLAERWQVAI
jgi:hypothetical protein